MSTQIDTAPEYFRCWHCTMYAMAPVKTIGDGKPTEGFPINTKGTGRIDLCECGYCGARQAEGDAYVKGGHWDRATLWVAAQHIPEECR